LICTQSGTNDGIISLLGFTPDSDNIIALEGPADTGCCGGLDYAVALGDVALEVDCSVDPCNNPIVCASECQDVTCIDLPTDCDNLICTSFVFCADPNPEVAAADCTDGAVCSASEGVETDCADEFEGIPIDNDGDLLANCADPDCFDDPACVDEGGGGGGGGSCSIATGSVGLANALILLVPAFGIGIRRIRRRLSK